MATQKAVFWIASKDFEREAAYSAMSFREQHPVLSDVKTFLVGPDVTSETVHPVFNYFFRTSPQESDYWFLDSTRYFVQFLNATAGHCEKLVYLDTDTFVCRPLNDLFFLLDRFDLAGAHAPGRWTRNTRKLIPPSFPEWNIGVQAIRNNADVRATFLDWLKYYRENADFYGNNDQASLREILWDNNRAIRFTTLPPEYNFRFGFGGWVRNEVVVLHGRSSNIRKVEKRVNAETGFRAWGQGEL